jgi:hypothetical protein
VESDSRKSSIEERNKDSIMNLKKDEKLLQRHQPAFEQGSSLTIEGGEIA